MGVHATLTPSGRALMALYSAIRKAIILFKGIYHFRGGRGVSTLGFSKRGRVQSIRSIPQVSLAFHQTALTPLVYLSSLANVNQCVWEETSSGTVLTAPPSLAHIWTLSAAVWNRSVLACIEYQLTPSVINEESKDRPVFSSPHLLKSVFNQMHWNFICSKKMQIWKLY